MRPGLWQEVTTCGMHGRGPFRRQLPQVGGEWPREASRSGSLQRLCHAWPHLAVSGDRGVVSRTAEIQGARSWGVE